MTNEFMKKRTSQVLKEAEALIYDLKQLEDLPESVWDAPVAQGKWTLKEMICHLWKWDQYLVDEMIPKMKHGAVLPAFIDIEQYNQQAIEATKVFVKGGDLLEVFRQTRRTLLDSIESIYDPSMRFTIVGERGKFSIDSFLMIFVNHDEHHYKQVELLLGSHLGENQAEIDILQLTPNLKGIQRARIVELEAIHLVGLATRTTNAVEMSEKAKIPKLWEQFWQAGVRECVSEQLGAESIYSLYSDYENGAAGEYNILVGYRVLNFAGLSNMTGLQSATIPPAKYAVFTTNRGPIMDIVPEAWQAIWEWEATADRERSYSGDFELYDERSVSPEDSQLDIYIAIK